LAKIEVRVCDRCEARQASQVKVWTKQGTWDMDLCQACLEDALPGQMKPHRSGRKGQRFEIVALPDDPIQ